LQKSGRVRDPSGRAARMTKYRRKTANAKERERMKMVNQAFDRLREVMPDLNLILDQEKETKVYTETRNLLSFQQSQKKFYFSSL
jgi:hypothetical protein